MRGKSLFTGFDVSAKKLVMDGVLPAEALPLRIGVFSVTPMDHGNLKLTLIYTHGPVVVSPGRGFTRI